MDTYAGDNILIGAVSILLGLEGVRAYLNDVQDIRGRGQVPVMLFCVAGPDCVLATSVSVPRPTLH